MWGDFGSRSPPYPALSRHPRGPGVLQSRAPERRALSALRGRALPTPGRRAAPALSKDAALARAEPTSPGMRDSPRDLPADFPPSLVPLPEAIPPPFSAIPLKCPSPGGLFMARLSKRQGIRKRFCFSDFCLPQKTSVNYGLTHLVTF